MINNLEYFIKKKYGKGKRMYFAHLLWPNLKWQTKSAQKGLNNKIRGYVRGDPKTFKLNILERMCELLDLTKVDELWLPLEKDK